MSANNIYIKAASENSRCLLGIKTTLEDDVTSIRTCTTRTLVSRVTPLYPGIAVAVTWNPIKITQCLFEKY